jgi:cell division initiation protein
MDETTLENTTGSTPTAQEVRERSFRKSFRGYEPNEVDSFLGEIATVVEEAQLSAQRLQGKVTDLEKQLETFHGIEGILQQTLAHAQETSGRVVENARKEAELILHQAELKAAEMLEKARADLASLKEQITILIAKKDSIVTRLQLTLRSELDLVKGLADDPELGQHHAPPQQSSSSDKSDIEDIIREIK